MKQVEAQSTGSAKAHSGIEGRRNQGGVSVPTASDGVERCGVPGKAEAMAGPEDTTGFSDLGGAAATSP